MSELASLMGFDVNDVRSREQWALTHFANHQAIRDAIQAQGHGNLTLWPLYPVAWDDWSKFSEWHQSAHNEMARALGVSTTDLTGVDLSDTEAAQQWNMDHFSEHAAASAALGI